MRLLIIMEVHGKLVELAMNEWMNENTMALITIYTQKIYTFTAAGAPTSWKYKDIRTVQPTKTLSKIPRPETKAYIT